jgi:flagellar FliL protein
MATSAPRAVPRPARPAPAVSPEAPVEKKSGRIVLWILLVALLLAGTGAGAWYLMNQSAKPAPLAPPVFVVLEPFTVNLQDNGGEYLHLSITLQVADNTQADQLKLYLPQLRSRLLMLLSSQKSAELSTVEGKKKLSADIAAQSSLPFTPQGAPHKVSNVFFTSFVIQ